MKSYKFIFVLFVLFTACQRAETPDPVTGLVKQTLRASLPKGDGTKTVVGGEDDTQILWVAGEEKVSIYSSLDAYREHTFTKAASSGSSPQASAEFKGEAPAGLTSNPFITLYPYDSSVTILDNGTTVTVTGVNLPATQTAEDGSFENNLLITAAKSTGNGDNNVSLKHVCSGLRFKVSGDKKNIKSVSIRGNNGEKIAGDFSFSFVGENPIAGARTEEIVTLTAPSGGFKADTYYYIVILPTTFSKGLTIYAETDSQIGELVLVAPDNPSNPSVTFSRGKFKDLSAKQSLDNRIMTWNNYHSQAYYGPQNTFCLRPGDEISIDVTPRKLTTSWQRTGFASTADRANSAAVLWGPGINGASGSPITARLSDNTLTVTAPSGTTGSSLVAIKNGSTILWSYLIWVTESAPAETVLPSGAKVLPALGGNCYFQWGRKDPLKADAVRRENEEVGDLPYLSYSISHPEEFIKSNSNTGDWYSTVQEGLDSSLWGEEVPKTVWDPCPAGYRVPAKDDYSGITEENLTSYYFEELGYIADDDYYDTDYSYWTRSTDYFGYVRKVSYALNFPPLDEIVTDILTTTFRYQAFPVRCVKE